MQARAAVLGFVLAAVAWPAAARADDTPLPSTVTLVGSLQSELGCPGDWQPECAQTALAPVAGSPGVFRATFDVPAGGYEYKVALNGSWDENYGAGGVAGGSNIALKAPGGALTFTYDHHSHVIADDAPFVLASERAAHWLRGGLIAWRAPAAASYALVWAPEGGLKVAGGAIAGGSSAPLTPVASGLPADVRAQIRSSPATARCSSQTTLAGRRARSSPAKCWSPPTTPAESSSAPPASRSPACSTTSTRARTPRGSAPAGTAGGRRSPSGRRRPSASTCSCATSRCRCGAATTASGA